MRGEAMEGSAFDWLVKGALGILMGIVAFFTKQVVGDVARLKDSQHSDKLDLANYKTEVANNYATQKSVHDSLSRIHDRIDDVATDIKTILGKVK